VATKTIVVASQKGGIGKTTTAVSLAHGLTLRGKKVLLVDLDNQAQCSTMLGKPQEPGVFKWLSYEITEQKALTFEYVRQWLRLTDRDRLALLPGDQTTDLATGLAMSAGREFIGYFKHCVAVLRKVGLDYIVFDTRPSRGLIQDAAVWTSDYILIPVCMEFASVEGALAQFEILKEYVKTGNWPGKLLGLLPTMLEGQVVADNGRKVVRGGPRDVRINFEALVDTFGQDLILDPIHRAIAFRESVTAGKTIFEMPLVDEYVKRAQEDYMGLVKYVLSVH
jgi:chromosome partitioning protein